MFGLWKTSTMALLGSARNYVSSLTTSVWVMLILVFTVWLMAIPNSTEWVHLLPLLGATLGTWAVFKEQVIRMRLFMSIGTLSWLNHNHLVASIGGVIIEGMFLVVNGRKIFRLFKE
jgi:hypothetical protein